MQKKNYRKIAGKFSFTRKKKKKNTRIKKKYILLIILNIRNLPSLFRSFYPFEREMDIRNRFVYMYNNI